MAEPHGWQYLRTLSGLKILVGAMDPSAKILDYRRVRLHYSNKGPRPSSYCRVRDALFDQNGAMETAFITSLRTKQRMRYSTAHDSLDLLLENQRIAGESTAASRVIRGNHAYLKVAPELFTTKVEYTGGRGKDVTWQPYRGPDTQRFTKGEWLVTGMENH